FAGPNLASEAPFVNRGVVLHTGNGLVGLAADFTNDGIYDLQADGFFEGGTFVNAAGGLFTGGTHSSNVHFFNTFTNAGGTVHVTGAGLRFISAYTQTAGLTTLDQATWAVPLVDLRGGRLVGSGTIVGNVRNAGEVSVGGDQAAGLLTVMGNYTQTHDGILTVEIGGHTPGVDYDVLAVTGTAALDGALNVGLLNGFVPSGGDTFQVLTCGSRSGVFDPALSSIDPSFLPPVYDPMDVTLQAF